MGYLCRLWGGGMGIYIQFEVEGSGWHILGVHG